MYVVMLFYSNNDKNIVIKMVLILLSLHLRMKTKHKQQKCFEVSILAGSLKGKKILIPSIATTRSTKSIMRESLFNTLQFDIIDKNFVEVFAGSGSVGIEAISRGAKDVYFIEKGNSAYEILQKNISSINATNAHITKADSFIYFENLYSKLLNDGTKTYFYFDPPFDIREGMEEIYENTLELIKMIDANICEMAIVEHKSSLILPKEINTLHQIKSKKFGKSTLTYYAPIDSRP